MNREDLTEAIHDLASTPHMAQYALEHAMAGLELRALAELFDTVADHHELVVDLSRRLAQGVDVDVSRLR